MSAWHAQGAPTVADPYWRCTTCKKWLGRERRRGPGRTGDQAIYVTEDNRVLCERCWHRERDAEGQPQQLRFDLGGD